MRVTKVREGKVKSQEGFTLIELIISMLMLSILAACTMPVARHVMRWHREQELKKTLREIRHAIDAYHAVCNAPQGQPTFGPFAEKKDATCYPPSLKRLEKGEKLNTAQGETVRFLLRIPPNPITGVEAEDNEEAAWEFRSVNEEPGDSWNGKSIFDVRCKSDERAIDGTYYRDW